MMATPPHTPSSSHSNLDNTTLPTPYSNSRHGFTVEPVAATSTIGPRHPPSRYVAVAAQQVHIGPDGRIPMVARVVLVNYRGICIYDAYVRPSQPVVNYRTDETGLEARHLENALPFQEVQFWVAEQIRGKILVGHAIEEFLLVMGISHPTVDTRDTALFLPFRTSLRTQERIPLATLVQAFMTRNIGRFYEEPLEQARAALDLFRSTEDMWETLVASGRWPSALPPAKFANYFV